MDRRTNQILFALLRSAVSGEKLTDKEHSIYTPDLASDLLKLAAKHDLAHLLALGLKKNNLISQENAGVEKNILTAVYRYERLEYDYVNLCNTLESAQIPFLPLKGSVLRNYYPEAWMRTSCDIDILVCKEDLDRAVSVLVDTQGYISEGYTYNEKGAHDISLFSPSKVHLELHFDLIEDGLANESSKVLRSVWDDATLRNGYAFWHEMSDALFYFYHIAHMAKHFENGGCGIRPFIDQWILDNMQQANVEKRRKLLTQGGLLEFAERAQKLSRVWFEGEKCDTLSQQMENYLLYGGVYGNYKNRVFVQQQKQGGRLHYVLSKMFLPYSKLKVHYPVLEKHPWLTPFMEIRRWLKLLFGGHVKRIQEELQHDGNVSGVGDSDAKAFLKNIGL